MNLFASMALLFADVSTWGMSQWAICIVVAVVLIGIVLIVMHEAGVVLPAYMWKIGGLVLLAIVAILAIKFVATL